MGYCYPLAHTEQKIRTILARPSDQLFVAVVEGAVVGYIHACDYDLIYAPQMKNIMGIAVSSNYKRHGIGRALLEQVERWARDSGAAGVRLSSGSTRTGSHAFYHTCGYTGDKQQLTLKKMF